MEFKFSDAITINPSEKIKKGELIKKISMQNIKERNRNILDYEIAPYSSGSKFRNKDTLFARITPCLENGKTAQVNILNDDEIAFGSTEFIVFRARTGITIPDYVYFLSISECIRQQAIKSMTGTSGRQRVQNSIFDEITIEVPSIEEQEKIVGILNSLDSKIEINNKIISNLESQAQAIFKSWFVDFEPFQDGEFVESELGMIPEGWEVKKVNEICDLKIGRTPPRKESEWFSLKEGVKWVSIKDLGLSQMYISEVTEYLTEESIEKFNIPIVEENTLLLSFKLTVGRIAITTEKMCTNEAIAQFKDPLISTLFLFYYFKNFKFETLGNTSSIGNAVNSKIIKNIEVLVPPEKIVLKVMKMIEPLSICIRNLLNQNTKLAEMRDALLPKLMAGEIDVSNIKIEGEEVKNE